MQHSAGSQLESLLSTESQTTKRSKLRRGMIKLKDIGVTHLLSMISDDEFKEISVDKQKFKEAASACGALNSAVSRLFNCD